MTSPSWIVGLYGSALLLGLAVSGCGKDPPTPDESESGPFFTVAGPKSGVTHVNLSGPTAGEGKTQLLDCIGPGIAILDADGDGWMDLYFPQGQGGEMKDGDSRNLLYLNGGDGTFEEVGEAWGVADEGYGFGALAFDYDGDGDTDLLVTNLGTNRLYRNEGARFIDVTDQHEGIAGAGDDWTTGAATADVDLDGDLDLYLANYFVHDPESLRTRGFCPFMGCEVPCGPHGMIPQPDVFLLNSGFPDYRYTVASLERDGASFAPSYGFQPVFSDVDGDGDPDLYVANDSVENALFINDGTGRFSEMGLVAGVSVGGGGQMEAGMGVALGDIDGDRLPEIYVTNFSTQANAFYKNSTKAGDSPWFDEASSFAGLGPPTWFDLSWGCCLADLDCDGEMDVVSSNGHVYPQVDGCDLPTLSYYQVNRLFAGKGGGRFVEVGDAAGIPFSTPGAHRGMATGDLDNDGDLDLVFNRLDGTPLLAWNESPNRGNWLQVTVEKAEEDERAYTLAVGATAHVTAGGRSWSRTLIAGSSFLGTDDPRLHFGLGEVQSIDALEITIPGIGSHLFEGISGGRHVTISASRQAENDDEVVSWLQTEEDL